MIHRQRALTEKEKETLRLLLSGYDAKSMARRLGLSVHTVNERLRDARRKMAVSSSREAARLLREAEGAPPELLGDKPLGDAALPTTMERSEGQNEGSAKWRRAGWIVGVAVMTFALALLALSALGGDAGPTGPAPTASSSPSQTAAAEAGRQWLGLLDSSDWTASYAQTAAGFRAANTEAMWADASRQARSPLGAIITRQLISADFTPSPPEGSWVVKFRTRYANRASAIETLSLIHEDGRMKVTGVVID